MKTKQKKKIIFSIIALVISFFIFFLLSEITLRLMGFSSWKEYQFDSNEPVAYQFDQVLGWKHLPGVYTFPKKAPEGQDFIMTFLDDGRRTTGPHAPKAVANIVFVGGSFTQGWAISDQDTFSSKIQKKLPSLNIKNYGVGGYSTYQALLTLEKELPRLTPPTVVFYGIIEHHENRNVASKEWLEALSKHSRRKHVYLPYCTLNQLGQLERHPPEAYSKFPLIKWSATITALNQLYMHFKTVERVAKQRQTTEKIILEMDKVCRKNKSRFVVLLFFSTLDTAKHYAGFLKQNKISFISCLFKPTKQFIVPGDGHPNGALNSIWAEKISNILKTSLEMNKKESAPAVKK